MKRPEFTREQEDWLCWIIGEWYLLCKNTICSTGEPHNLGFAVNNLKDILCDIERKRREEEYF